MYESKTAWLEGISLSIGYFLSENYFMLNDVQIIGRHHISVYFQAKFLPNEELKDHIHAIIDEIMSVRGYLLNLTDGDFHNVQPITDAFKAINFNVSFIYDESGTGYNPIRLN